MRTNGLFSGLINLVADAVKTAVTDYVSVAIMCNEQALTDVPYGKYHPKYELDAEGIHKQVKAFLKECK